MKIEEEGLQIKNRNLLQAIKNNLGEIDRILRESSPYFFGEDFFYRLYHGSFKVYLAQRETDKIISLMRKIGLEAGQGELNVMFLEIVREGTGKTFDMECNLDWGKRERPIMEAFFHAREMLRLMGKYGKVLHDAPESLPSGWAAVLYLYNMR